jgi:hypothetical protein
VVFDLAPVVARLARDHGMQAAIRAEMLGERHVSGNSSSVWVAVARSREHLGSLNDNDLWRRLSADSRAAWTDDFSNVGSALNWR